MQQAKEDYEEYMVKLKKWEEEMIDEGKKKLIRKKVLDSLERIKSQKRKAIKKKKLSSMIKKLGGMKAISEEKIKAKKVAREEKKLKLSSKFL